MVNVLLHTLYYTIPRTAFMLLERQTKDHFMLHDFSYNVWLIRFHYLYSSGILTLKKIIW